MRVVPPLCVCACMDVCMRVCKYINHMIVLYHSICASPNAVFLSSLSLWFMKHSSGLHICASQDKYNKCIQKHTHLHALACSLSRIHGGKWLPSSILLLHAEACGSSCTSWRTTYCCCPHGTVVSTRWVDWDSSTPAPSILVSLSFRSLHDLQWTCGPLHSEQRWPGKSASSHQRGDADTPCLEVSMGRGCLDCCWYFNAQRQTKDMGYSVLSSKETVHTWSVLDVVVDALVCISLPECNRWGLYSHKQCICPVCTVSSPLFESLDRKQIFCSLCTVYELILCSSLQLEPYVDPLTQRRHRQTQRSKTVKKSGGVSWG